MNRSRSTSVPGVSGGTGTGVPASSTATIVKYELFACLRLPSRMFSVSTRMPTSSDVRPVWLTVAENIAFARKHATREEIEAAVAAEQYERAATLQGRLHQLGLKKNPAAEPPSES